MTKPLVENKRDAKELQPVIVVKPRNPRPVLVPVHL
jgi:hypothetical protein